MQLEADTLAVLINFSNMNPGLVVRPGNVLKTVSTSKSVIAKATLSQTFEKEFAIADLSRLIRTISLFKGQSPEISFMDSNLLISAEKQQIKYAYSDYEHVKIKLTNENFEENLAKKKSFAQFNLDKNLMLQAMKASVALGNPQLAFIGANGKIVLESMNIDVTLYDKYMVEIGDTDAEFKVVFDIANLNFLAQNDYHVNFLYSDKGLGATFSGHPYEYVVAMKASHSTFSSS
jgi:hypothetical protein